MACWSSRSRRPKTTPPTGSRRSATGCTRLVESRQDGRFAIDLSDVNYLASSEIGFLMTSSDRIDRRQGKVVMFGVGAYLHDIFRTMNLTQDHRHRRDSARRPCPSCGERRAP